MMIATETQQLHRRLASSRLASTSARSRRVEPFKRLQKHRASSSSLHFSVSSSSTPESAVKPSSSSSSSSSSISSIVGDYYQFANHSCYYERFGDAKRANVHVIFLHGFGVGTFHYTKQLIGLGSEGDSSRTCAWSMDICGQGKSWPKRREDVAEFEYSLDSWRDQVEYFIREVVLKAAADSEENEEVKIVLAGNSLGGKLALYVSATCEDLIDGIVLLNATPFWGFLEKRVSFLTKENDFIVKLTQPYWDNFRSQENVRRLLNLVYADESKIEESLIEDIIAPTENEHAIRAFISTFTSPKASRMSYDKMLEVIRDRNDSIKVAMCYGREDPWVVPLWGQRLKRVVTSAKYYELSPAGHCPHDEAPECVNAVIRSLIGEWFSTAETVAPPKSIDGVSIELVDGSPRNVFEKLDYWKDRYLSSSAML